MDQNKKGVQNWIGFSFYITTDFFVQALMSQVVPLPTRAPVYRKERLSGMYSPHSYYLSLWLAMNLILVAYPILVSLFTFYFIGFEDDSISNLIQYMLTAVLTCLAGSNFGFMWGALFTNEHQATISALLYISISSLGAG
jgi:hypothetical protein